MVFSFQSFILLPALEQTLAIQKWRNVFGGDTWSGRNNFIPRHNLQMAM
jgi:hypothetical protein